jgi:hypothetical protein
MSYAEANERGKQLALYAHDISEPQQRRIIAAPESNDQIRDSFEVGRLISALKETGKIEKVEFDKLLVSCGLRKFV